MDIRNHLGATEIDSNKIETTNFIAYGLANFEANVYMLANASITDNLTVGGNADVTGYTNVTAGLNVTGNSVLSGTLTVTGNADVTGYINADGGLTQYDQPYIPMFRLISFDTSNYDYTQGTFAPIVSGKSVYVTDIILHSSNDMVTSEMYIQESVSGTNMAQVNIGATYGVQLSNVGGITPVGTLVASAGNGVSLKTSLLTGNEVGRVGLTFIYL